MTQVSTPGLVRERPEDSDPFAAARERARIRQSTGNQPANSGQSDPFAAARQRALARQEQTQPTTVVPTVPRDNPGQAGQRYSWDAQLKAGFEGAQYPARPKQLTPQEAIAAENARLEQQGSQYRYDAQGNLTDGRGGVWTPEQVQASQETGNAQRGQYAREQYLKEFGTSGAPSMVEYGASKMSPFSQAPDYVPDPNAGPLTNLGYQGAGMAGNIAGVVGQAALTGGAGAFPRAVMLFVDGWNRNGEQSERLYREQLAARGVRGQELEDKVSRATLAMRAIGGALNLPFSTGPGMLRAAGEGAIFGGGQDLAQQGIGVGIGAQDEIDPMQAAQAAALGGGAGAALNAGPDLVEQIVASVFRPTRAAAGGPQVRRDFGAERSAAGAFSPQNAQQFAQPIPRGEQAGPEASVEAVEQGWPSELSQQQQQAPASPVVSAPVQRPADQAASPVPASEQASSSRTGSGTVDFPVAPSSLSSLTAFWKGRDNAELRSVRGWLESNADPDAVGPYAEMLREAKSNPGAFFAEVNSRPSLQPPLSSLTLAELRSLDLQRGGTGKGTKAAVLKRLSARESEATARATTTPPQRPASQDESRPLPSGVGSVAESTAPASEGSFGSVASQKPQPSPTSSQSAGSVREPWEMRRDEYQQDRFVGGPATDIVPIDDVSDYQTLESLVESGKLRDGTYVVGAGDVAEIKDGKASIRSDLHAKYDYKAGKYTINRRVGEREGVLYHGTRGKVRRASELRPGKDWGPLGENEYRAVYLTSNPEDAKSFAHTGPDAAVIEARLSQSTKIVTPKEAAQIVRNAADGVNPTEALKIAGVDAVGKKDRRGDYYEIAVVNPGVLVDADSHRSAVERALSEGKPVPPEVLADYPDLQPKAPAKGVREPWQMTRAEFRKESKWFHGTSREAAQSIEGEGFKPATGYKSGERPQRNVGPGEGASVWLGKKRLAARYAVTPPDWAPTTEGPHRGASRKGGIVPVALRENAVRGTDYRVVEEHGQQVVEVLRSSAVETHRQAVARALSEGRPVPQEVLADYPDLQPKAPDAETMHPDDAADLRRRMTLYVKKLRSSPGGKNSVANNASIYNDLGLVIRELNAAGQLSQQDRAVLAPVYDAQGLEKVLGTNAETKANTKAQAPFESKGPETIKVAPDVGRAGSPPQSVSYVDDKTGMRVQFDIEGTEGVNLSVLPPKGDTNYRPGTGEIRRINADILAKYPQLTRIRGERVTGAQKAAAILDATKPRDDGPGFAWRAEERRLLELFPTELRPLVEKRDSLQGPGLSRGPLSPEGEAYSAAARAVEQWKRSNRNRAGSPPDGVEAPAGVSEGKTPKDLAALKAKPEATPPARDDPTLTSARKEWTTEDRSAMGLDTIDSPARRSWEEALGRGKDTVDEDKARSLVYEINNTPENQSARILNDIETGGLVVEAARLKNKHREKLAEVEGMSSDEQIAAAGVELTRLEEDFDAITRALRRSGTEKGRALAAQKLTIDSDLSLVSVKSRAKAKKGKPLTEAESKAFAEQTAQLEAANKKIAELEEAMSKQVADRAIGRARRHYAKLSPEQRATELADANAKAKALLDAGCKNA